MKKVEKKLKLFLRKFLFFWCFEKVKMKNWNTVLTLYHVNPLLGEFYILKIKKLKMKLKSEKSF